MTKCFLHSIYKVLQSYLGGHGLSYTNYVVVDKYHAGLMTFVRIFMYYMKIIQVILNC